MNPPPVLPPLPDLGSDVDEFLSRPSAALVASAGRWSGPFLVLGAGGKMGLHLAGMLQRALRAAGRPERVIAVSRFATLRDRAAFDAQGVETLACDLSVPAAVEALPDAAAMFFLAGAKFGTSGDPALLRRINAEMPRLVAERYRRARVVAFSTGCVYPFVSPASGGAAETAPVDPRPGEYAASCLERERAFADAAARHGTAVALIRLNYAVEFRYGVLVDIASRVWRGEPIDVTTGYVNVIWQPDAIDLSLRALDLAAAPAVPVNVSGPQILRVRELAEEFGRLFGKPVTVVGKEAETAWLSDASWVRQRLGAPPTPVATMQRWIAAWLGQGGGTWGKPTAFERRDGQF
ncbi:MAG TPA: NAD(P)-dependent oxidoreductase [Opitutaceae bacterium]|nr:NAD(P)-dependent oxidoreductase [Opitutaceae bacterium]